MPIRHSKELQAKVLDLGLAGWTYAEIRNLYPIPKATLSYWFKNADKINDRAKQLKHLIHARESAVITINRKKLDRIKLAEARARYEINNISFQNIAMLKAMLAMLYWAEGTKSDTSSGVNFVNTDPLLAKLYISLLRDCYSINERGFHIRVHTHSRHDPATAIKFWSNTLNVPESQFGKIYVKKRSIQKKFRENFQGICFIYYGDGMIRRELLVLGRLIAEKQDTLSSFNG
ncbi:MAG: hypothetical protein ABIT47_04295 [Candidatus Paceibacterota bacterium]